MAGQNVTIAGASYTAVPSILVPKTGGGTASFVDTSDADATAEDILAGKTAYVNGTKVTGTGSGGGIEIIETPDSHGGTIIEITGTPSGGGTVKRGVLRPDAELVQTWAYDKWLVADEELTIPSYSTSSQTIRATSNIATYDGTPATYRYYIIQRCLTTPTYNIATLARGREEYCYSVAGYEWVYQPSEELRTLDGTKTYGQYSQICATGAFSREVYWNTETALGVYTSPAYCLAQTLQAPTVGSNKTITIKKPTITIRGNATYLAQTFFEAVTDARLQYRIELWRVPIDNVIGWTVGSQIYGLYKDIADNSGTLR